nr:MAG TPA: hypothetical protein [Inoviridae sp.]
MRGPAKPAQALAPRPVIRGLKNHCPTQGNVLVFWQKQWKTFFPGTAFGENSKNADFVRQIKF